MSASRFLYAGFIGLIACLLALFSSVAVVTMGSPNAHRVSAQQSSDLTISLTSNTTKAKVGDFVGFTVVVQNNGATTVSDLFINLGLPDALDARTINCPGDNHGSTTFCEIGDFAPGSIAEVLFAVQVGTKENNGPVTADASSLSVVLASAAIPPLKIVGPQRR
jgi:uncharacterized repeat protein (TIGR01451 family)